MHMGVTEVVAGFAGVCLLMNSLHFRHRSFRITTQEEGLPHGQRAMMSPSKRLKCRSCGQVLPAWLPVAKRPEGSMLLYHLSQHHPD
jgi:hypothetical protein